MLREIDIPPLWLALFAALGWGLGRIFPIYTLLDQVAGASDIEDVRASANEMARLLAKMG